MRRLEIKYDETAHAAYIRLSANPIVRTHEADDSVMFDIDMNGEVVGVEVLDVEMDQP